MKAGWPCPAMRRAGQGSSVRALRGGAPPPVGMRTKQSFPCTPWAGVMAIAASASRTGGAPHRAPVTSVTSGWSYYLEDAGLRVGIGYTGAPASTCMTAWMTSRCCGRKAALPNTRRLAKSSSCMRRSASSIGAKGSGRAAHAGAGASAAAGGGAPAKRTRTRETLFVLVLSRGRRPFADEGTGGGCMLTRQRTQLQEVPGRYSLLDVCTPILRSHESK